MESILQISNLPMAFLIVFLIIASVIDFKTFKIPNVLVVTGWVTGLVTSLIFHGWEGLLHSFLNSVFIFAILFPIWMLHMIRIPVIGAGDIKLYMMISTFISFQNTLSIVILSIFLGSFLFIFLIPPKKLIDMFRNFFYMLFYYIPNKKETNLKKISFAVVIFLAFLLKFTILTMI